MNRNTRLQNLQMKPLSLEIHCCATEACILTIYMPKCCREQLTDQGECLALQPPSFSLHKPPFLLSELPTLSPGQMLSPPRPCHFAPNHMPSAPLPGEMACTAAQTARSTCSATEQAAVVMRLDASGLMHSSSSPSWPNPLHSSTP